MKKSCQEQQRLDKKKISIAFDTNINFTNYQVPKKIDYSYDVMLNPLKKIKIQHILATFKKSRRSNLLNNIQ